MSLSLARESLWSFKTTYLISGKHFTLYLGTRKEDGWAHSLKPLCVREYARVNTTSEHVLWIRVQIVTDVGDYMYVQSLDV